MVLAGDVYNWWYLGFGGLGGWSLFFLLSVLAGAYVYFDSANKDIKAVGWRLGAFLPLLLFTPTLFYRFFDGGRTIERTASEWFLVLGVLGATISVAAAIGYAVTYWGYKPQPKQPAPPPVIVAPPRPAAPPPSPVPSAPVEPPKPQRPKADAWLVDANGHQHQLLQGDTRIGRSTRGNDIVLSDPSVSREHALIREQNGVFMLYDRGSKAGVYLNNHRLREPQVLYQSDVIQLGDVRLTFVSASG